MSENHINSSSAYESYSKLIDTLLEAGRELLNAKKEVARLENRKYMEPLVDIVICLSHCGKPFRRHDESKKAYKKYFFLKLYNYLESMTLF